MVPGLGHFSLSVALTESVLFGGFGLRKGTENSRHPKIGDNVCDLRV